jgi:hypothetical protein
MHSTDADSPLKIIFRYVNPFIREYVVARPQLRYLLRRLGRSSGHLLGRNCHLGGGPEFDTLF